MLPALGLLLVSLQSLQAIPVVPGIVGFGSQSAAARGATNVYRVTRLDDPALNNAGLVPGTLRYGVEHSSLANTPTVIVFDTSGVIQLQGDLIVRANHSYLTIAGQTAPWPGITLRNGAIMVLGHDVLVQHLAIRPGNYLHANVTDQWKLAGIDNRDCIKITPSSGTVSNVVFDHVSCSWSTDEVVSFWSSDPDDKRDTGGVDGPLPYGEVDGVTISRSLVGQPVIYAGHPNGGAHGYGPVVGPHTDNVSLIRNVMAFNLERNPLIRDMARGVQIANNFIYNPRYGEKRAIYIGTIDAGDDLFDLTVSAVGNVVLRQPYTLHGPNGDQTIPETGTGNAAQGFYVIDNSTPNVTTYLSENRLLNLASSTTPPISAGWFPSPVTNQYDSSFFRDRSTTPPVTKEYTTDPHANSGDWKWTPWSTRVVPGSTLAADRTVLEAKLVSNAGKFTARRDPLDAALFGNIQARSNSFVERLDPATNPWAPVDLVRTANFVLPANPDQDPDGDGYTNLEEALHYAAWNIEGDQRIATFDTFSDDDMRGWYPDDVSGAWSVPTGTKELAQTYTGGDAQAFLINTNFFNQVVEAKVKPVNFSNANGFVRVYARYQDPFNAYYVTLRNGSTTKVELKKITQGASSTLITTLAEANFSITTGTTYAVRISVNNPAPGAAASLAAQVTNLSTSAVVNLSATDSNPLPPGFAAVGTNYAEARFDDVFASPYATDVQQSLSDFDTNSTAGWTPDAPTAYWQAAGGVYQFTSQASVSGRTVTGTNVSSQTVQADVKIAAESGTNRFAAVYARHSDASNAYYLLLRADANTVELKKLAAGVPTEFTPAAHASTPVTLGEWYNLRLEVSGTNPVQLRGYVNGVLMVEATDTSNSGAGLPAGKAALGTNYVAADFDNVIVTSP